MKILLFTTHLDTGGISVYVTNLAKALAQRGNEVLVASSGGSLQATLSQAGIRHVSVDIRTKSELSPKVAGAFFFMHSLLKKENVDIIHAHTRVTQVVSQLLFFSMDTPYVTTCHGFFKKRLGRNMFGCWGRAVVAISESVQRQLLDDFKLESSKVKLIKTGIETERFTGLSLEPLPEPVIGTIGRLSSVKGQDVLIRAAKLLIADFPRLKVLLVGDGPEEKQLKSLARTLGIEKNITFVPSVEDTARMLSAMDVFVLPSINEGLGLSLMEAMASGRMCVASRVGGIQSLIEDGRTGFLARPGDPQDLARTIKNALDNMPGLFEIRRNARQKILADFDMARMVKEVEQMYRDVLSQDEVSCGKKY